MDPAAFCCIGRARALWPVYGQRRGHNAELERYGVALYHYRWASLMCPVRFAPLEGMYHVYRECGDSLHADSVSAVIRAKEVKVLSSEVVRIKEEVGRQTFR